jgi:hypothetical protein
MNSRRLPRSGALLLLDQIAQPKAGNPEDVLN